MNFFRKLRGLISARQSDDFDADFYRAHYSDLKGLKTGEEARQHFLNHGRSEGRFGTRTAWLLHYNTLIPGIVDTFDIVAYRHYNKDLARRFSSDDDLLRHYLTHGHEEGRKARFCTDQNMFSQLPDHEKWQMAFSSAEFVAFAGQWIKVLPRSRQEALAIFVEQGIERLWPISFDYAFDPVFVRNEQLMADCAGKTDAELYRLWLTCGFVNGVAPNEQRYLEPYLAGAPFPMNFPWQDFVRRRRLPRSTSRSAALAALFDSSSEQVVSAAPLMGDDARWLLELIGRYKIGKDQMADAVAILCLAVKLDPRPLSQGLLGDAYGSTGDTAKSLACYRAASAHPDVHHEIVATCMRMLLDAGRFDDALIHLETSHLHWRKFPAFTEWLQEALVLKFEATCAQALKQYRRFDAAAVKAGVREATDTIISEMLYDIADSFGKLDDLPGPVGPCADGYVAILANMNIPQCVHYRVEQKAQQFALSGIPVRIFSEEDAGSFITSLAGARAAIFYRVAATPPVIRAILHARTLGLDTWYEVDDLIFDPSAYPDPFESFGGQISEAEYAGLQMGVPLFRHALAMCDRAIASTPSLAKRMEALVRSGQCIVIRNGLDTRNDNAIRLSRHLPERRDGRVRLFYGSGTLAHNADFNNIAGPAITQAMARHDNVDLIVVGHLVLSPGIEAFSDRILQIPFMSDKDDYWSVLSSCDINIAVLADGPVADCKSEIKWLESAILNVASIVSDTATYREVIQPGVDGCIARNTEDWFAHLDRLISDKQVREFIGKNAHRKALLQYSSTTVADQLAFHFQVDLYQEGRLPVAGRYRVLICHVFFDPQSHGGATRVVENNVQDLAARYPDLDLAVACTVSNGHPPGTVTVGSSAGIPVFRLSASDKIRDDMAPFDRDQADGFKRILDHFRPDLVHFHCVQRLTATVVEVTAERNIPYLITHHDGWWFSDYQFLVDNDGFLQLPNDKTPDAKVPESGPAIARRVRLGSLLHQAVANLAVSKSFGEICSTAGVPRVIAIENGTHATKAIAGWPRQSGVVRLGHIGGRTAHKGAALVEAALRQGSYRNLQLVMVDGSLPVGHVVETLWGTTPVTLTPPCPLDAVDELFASFDVLLAPSIWPESFGLVSREARQRGKWVVASNLGAIADDIDTGVDGFVIDVSTTTDLSRILAELDNRPERFNAPLPERPVPLRTPADQAVDLHLLYTRIRDGQRDCLADGVVAS